jgi:hypothetical protein
MRRRRCWRPNSASSATPSTTDGNHLCPA